MGGEVLLMRKQLRKVSRRRTRLVEKSKAKRRTAKQEFRRQKTARLLEGIETNKGGIDWSPEQLERIWQNTMG
mgnify:CR=1 FL=1